MRFARMNLRQSRQMGVGPLSGGLNTREPAEYIGDDQLTDCTNMYFQADELATRPGFYTRADKVTRQAAEGDLPRQIARFTTADGRFSLIKTPKNTYVWNQSGEMIGSWTHAYDKVCEAGFFADGGEDTVLFFGVYTGAGWQITEITLTDSSASHREDIPVYVPTAFINARPTADLFAPECGGVPYEGYNLLSGSFKSLWTTDGDGEYYVFPIQIRPPVSLTYTDETSTAVTWDIPAGERTSANKSVTINGTAMSLHLCYNHSNNCVWLEDAAAPSARVALPGAGYADNVSVTATREGWSAEEGAQICGMNFSAWFGGTGTGVAGGTRLFVSGNGETPNLVRFSDVNRPTFFPANNFFYVGSQSEPVTAFGKQSTCLVIFKPHEMYTCEYAWSAISGEEVAAGVVPEVTSDAYFPLRQLHGGVGCDCPQTVQLCGNHLVWANAADGRVYTLVNLSNYTEKNVRDISWVIGPSLRGVLTADASAVLWGDHYVLLCGHRNPTAIITGEMPPPQQIFLFDYTQNGFTYFASYYDDKRASSCIPWYRWEFNTPFQFYADTYAVSRVTLMGKNGGAVLMGLYHVPGNDFFCPFLLKGETDCQAAYDERTVTVRESGPISGAFATKAYTFGLPQCEKTVEGLVMYTSGQGVLTAYWDTDRGDGSVPCAVPVQSDRPCPLRLPYRVSRVRTAGLTVQVTGRIGVSGLIWKYRRIGEVK